MNRIQVLDCTLRDGGYCNEWKFGLNNIHKIINHLEESQIDIVECGFLTNKVQYERAVSLFTEVSQLESVLSNKKRNSIYVAMINYGEYDLDKLSEYDGRSIDGIRLAFHKEDMEEALKWCGQIQKKGYKLFVQPMVTLNYSDEEFIELIHKCSRLHPYAFYIVDSFGVMKREDLIRLYYLVENNLDKDINIGYHSHNNMQLAYSNAQALLQVPTHHQLIIDTSVMGMGRGAGNLNTELFVEHLNNVFSADYKILPLLTLVDEVINDFYMENYWGYSLPNYLSAKYNSHPNYAMYLNDKSTLTYEDMDMIFSSMEDGKRAYYDKKYIEKLYVEYMNRGEVQEEHLAEIQQHLAGKRVLLIAPGRSVEDEKDKIIAFAKQPDVIVMELNSKYPYVDADYLFLSNLRRYRDIENMELDKAVVTSNIKAHVGYAKVSYAELLNDNEYVRDNAGMMAIRFLSSMGVEEILLAGMDGYSYDETQNYADSAVSMRLTKEMTKQMNQGMNQVLKKLSEDVKIAFLTKPKHIRLE